MTLAYMLALYSSTQARRCSGVLSSAGQKLLCGTVAGLLPPLQAAAFHRTFSGSPVRHYGVAELAPQPSSRELLDRADRAGALAAAAGAQHVVTGAPACEPAVNQATVLTSEMQASAAGGFSTGVTTQPSGQGFKKTFYKRKLPTPPSIAFASNEGRQLFAEALAAGHMSGFFKLMEQFSTQDEPSFCGLASLAMVLNALAIDPRRTWKGAWRWFHEQMLDCCRPLEDVKREGITLPQAACLSRCNGARVVHHRYGTFTEGDLRQQVLDVCSSGEQHLVVSYSRRTFLQTGDGHFSPIGGYHAARDLVLILDVARFKYPPHWVPLSMLYDAMKYIDPVTSMPRGFLRMSAQPLLTSVLLTLDVRSSCWQRASDWVRTAAPQLATAAATAAAQLVAVGPAGLAQPYQPEPLVASLLAALPMASLDAFVMLRHNCITQGGAFAPVSTSRDSLDAGGGDGGSTAAADGSGAAAAAAGVAAGEAPERCLPVGARQQLLRELRALSLFTVVQGVMQRSGQLDACTQLTCEHSSPSPQPSPPDHQPGAAQPPNPALDDESDNFVPGLDKLEQSQQQGTTVPAPSTNAAPSQHGTTAPAPAAIAAPLTVGANNTVAAAAHVHKASSGCCQPPGDHVQLQQQGSGELLAPSQPCSGIAPQQALGQGGAVGPQGGGHHLAASAAPPTLPVQQQHLNSGYLAEKATMLLLLLGGEEAWPRAWVDPEAGKAWAALMDTSSMSIVETELAFLREQWTHIDEVVQTGSVESQCSAGCSQKLDCAVLKC